jgi:hypothetical protein|tara:strand:- start:1019 stop:1573 length:555 start_codon:yes stop_codon:yes gene_type:complete
MINTTHYTVSTYEFNSPKGLGIWGWCEGSQTFHSLKEAEEDAAENEASFKRILDDGTWGDAAHMEEVRKKHTFKINEIAVNYTHASHYMYTDVDAFEIVKVISDKTIEIRRMKTDHNIKGLTTYVGGFSGHVANQHAQTVTYESNPEADVIRIRKKKNSKDWWVHKGMKFMLKESPYAFYDFNF